MRTGMSRADGDGIEREECGYCDEPGGVVTYANQVLLPLNGKVRCIDFCIHHIVAALNASAVRTTDCCCGHGRMPGYIGLEDGRVLVIFASREEARMCDTPGNNENTRSRGDKAVWQPPRLDGTR